MLAALMVTVTEDLEGSFSSKMILPAHSLKRPFTVLTTIWVTENPMLEWAGSILYSSAAKAEPQIATTVKTNPKNLRIPAISPCCLLVLKVIRKPPQSSQRY